MVSNLFAACCIFVFAIALYGYLHRIPENRCEMTYMFQWPEYVEIHLPKEIQQEFPRYGLYVYGEGQYAEYLGRGKFRGIPVLFIPGNAGSHRQVRSLGSVSMVKTERSQNRKNVPEFNYFSIDFDEELSGLYGGFLQRQTEFAAICIRKILELYEKEKRPKSIVVVGHSMGGIVARGLFSTQNFSSSLINVLITLASPHAAPVATFDTAMQGFYDQIIDFWIQNIDQSLRNLTVLSIGGGGRDVMVRSDLTKFDHRLKSKVGNFDALTLFETMATEVPWVWATTDHLCIVWCKQLVMATVRALFDMASGGSMSQDVQVHRQAIKYHFFERSDWKMDQKAMKARQLMLEDEERMRQDLWAKLASVIRYYAHLMPSLCLGYICSGMIWEWHQQRSTQRESFRNAISKVFGFSTVSTLFALRIKNEGDFASAIVAVLMAFGLFSMTKLVAAAVLMLRRCCRPRAIRAPSKLANMALLAAVLLLLATSMYSMTLLVLFPLIAATVVSQIRLAAIEEAVVKETRLVVQTCVVLVGLMGPWTVVWGQNLIRGGPVLPHDPSFVPALLWMLANLFSMLCQPNGVKRTVIPLVIGLVTIGFSDRLYLTTYCCSVLLGFWFGRGTPRSLVELSKVE